MQLRFILKLKYSLQIINQVYKGTKSINIISA